MNRIFPYCLLLLMFFAGPSWAGLYKCKDNRGNISYQGSPCPGGDVSPSVRINVKAPAQAKPLSKTRKNEQLLRHYTVYENQKPVVKACALRGSNYSRDISEAHERFYKTSKAKIDKGLRIFKAGFVGSSASELRTIQREAMDKQVVKLRNMNMSELNHACMMGSIKLLSFLRSASNSRK